jgi:Tfp pilus assembly protein PilF
MRNKILIILLFIIFLSFCSNDRFSIIENSNYRLKINKKLGTYAQKQNLWKEAIFRWKNVIKLAPKNYKAHNNLAVAYESIGDYKNAEKEYKLALKLNNNSYIKKNYEDFKAMLKNKNNKKSKRGKYEKIQK